MKSIWPLLLLPLAVSFTGCAGNMRLQPFDAQTGKALGTYTVVVERATLRKLSLFPTSDHQACKTNVFFEVAGPTKLGPLSHDSGVNYNILIKARGFSDARIVYLGGVDAVLSPDGIRVAELEPLRFWDGISPIGQLTDDPIRLPMVPEGVNLQGYWQAAGVSELRNSPAPTP